MTGENKKKSRPKLDDESVLRHALRQGGIPYRLLEYDDGKFTEKERLELLRMLTGLMVYTGCAVPYEVELRDGTVIPLKQIVWTLITKKEHTADELAAAQELANILKHRAKLNKKALKQYDLSDEEAEKIFFEACGLLRAVMLLKGLSNKDDSEITESMRKQKIRDARKLLDFLESIKI
jgi:hypothetical protein